ncbi:Fic family protein [Lysobacter sp. GCM10012299]|uniref:Fic family protein n=1 Tax=Lysobacter sp. GCM10012299 TaxID=3317333 RepID=UPI0036106B67
MEAPIASREHVLGYLVLARVAGGELADQAQARRFALGLLRQQRYATSTDHLQLVGSIVPGITGFREENVFTGGRTAGDAAHLFPPHAALPELMAELDRVPQAAYADRNPLEVAAMIGFYGAHTHPFLDGNGRWSRLLALASGSLTGDWESSALASVYLQCARDHLCEHVWPKMRLHGLQTYLDGARVFATETRMQLHERRLHAAAVRINGHFKSLSPASAPFEACLADIYAEGRISLATIKDRFGMSDRKLGGFTDRITLSGEDPWVRSVPAGQLSIASLLAEANALASHVQSRVKKEQ